MEVRHKTIKELKEQQRYFFEESENGENTFIQRNKKNILELLESEEKYFQLFKSYILYNQDMNLYFHDTNELKKLLATKLETDNIITKFMIFIKGLNLKLQEKNTSKKTSGKIEKIWDSYKESIKEYHTKMSEKEKINKIVKSVREKYLLKEKRIFWKYYKILTICDSLEDLERILKNEKTCSIIKFGKEGIVKKIWNLYKIEKLEDFENLAKKEKIVDIIRFGNEKIFEKIVALYKIEKSKDLENLANKRKIVDIIKFGNEKIFKKIVNLYKIEKLEDFENLAKEEKIVDIIRFGNEKIFEKIVALYKIEKSKDLEKILEKKEIVFLLKYAKGENIEYFLNLLKIKTGNELEKTITGPKREHYKKAMKNCGKKEIVEIQRINSNNSGIVIEQKIGNTKKSVNACEKAELKNLEILEGKSIQYLGIKKGKKILGYVKGNGSENSYLSLENVFDEYGELIFLKGWIYHLEGDKDERNYSLMRKYGKEKSINLNIIKKRNPIRKIRLENFDGLVEDFLKNLGK